MKRWLRWILIALIVLPILAVGGFYGWATLSLREADADALADTVSTNTMQVTETANGWLTFMPLDLEEPVITGIIFYPGGLVDHRGYSPPLRKIAAEGYFVVVVEMPLNMAFFSPEKATDVIAAYPEITNWAIAGHSLGGSMAGRYVYNNPGAVDGLILWAAYMAKEDNIASSGIPALSIMGTEDQAYKDGTLEERRLLLPADTVWVIIEGGNHAQFGNYIETERDKIPTTLPFPAQQAQIVEATLEFLAQFGAE